MYSLRPHNSIPIATMRLLSPDSVSSDESLPPRIIPINFHSKTGYSAYESAPLDVRFSEDYIEQLTVGDLMAPDFNIPLALPDGAVFSTTFLASSHLSSTKI
jgi:hypothetical protein